MRQHFFFTEWSLRNIWKRRQWKLMQRHISDGQKWKLAGKGVKCAIGPWAAQWQGHASLHQVFGYAWAFTIRCHWMITWAYKPIHVRYPTWVPTAKQFVFKFCCLNVNVSFVHESLLKEMGYLWQLIRCPPTVRNSEYYFRSLKRARTFTNLMDNLGQQGRCAKNTTRYRRAWPLLLKSPQESKKKKKRHQAHKWHET